MPQIFHPSMNTVARASVFGAILLAAGAGWATVELYRSPYITNAGIVREQPVPFSHEHHVRGLGIDCRYCHTSVENSHFAGVPPTKVCMTCHSQIWTNAELLQPVRQSWATNVPVRWTRVNYVPGYAYFVHDAHVNMGIGCVTCHGQVDNMPLMYQASSLRMEWCLNCHRAPERYIRPREEVYNLHYDAGDYLQALRANPSAHDWTGPVPESPLPLGVELVNRYHILSPQQMTNCSLCHR